MNIIENIGAAIHQPLVVLDAEYHVKSANPSFHNTFEIREEDADDVLFFELVNRQWIIPQLYELLGTTPPANAPARDVDMLSRISEECSVY